MKKTVLFISILALTGCGGSDDSGNGLSPDSFVSGSFEDASITGQSFPVDRATHGYYGSACVDEMTYFESARVRVYGSTAFSEDDFKAMASIIEQRLDGAFAKFGLAWDDVRLNDRPVFTAGSTNSMLPYLVEDLKEAEGSPGSWDIDTGDAYTLWKQMTDEEKIAFADVVRQRDQDFIDQFAGEDVGLEPVVLQRLSREFVIGCLSPRMSGSTFGEGTLAGILMPPEYRQWPGSVGEIVTHEIIHSVQNNLMFDAGNGYLAPRWFTEGQAVFLSGQRIASPGEHYNYEPQDVVGFYDEYGDPGMAYRHYGLAYKYIHDHNSMESIVAMLRQMKEALHDPSLPESRLIGMRTETLDDGTTFEVPIYGDESKAFQVAFDANMVDHNGDPLTIDRFRNDYHDLMNAAY